MVGVWLVVLASSPTLYGKVPRLILKKTSRLTQAVVFFRRHFLCGALLCNCSSAEREGLSTHYTTRVFSRTLYAQNPITKNLHISPRSSPTIFYRDANSVLLLLISHLCTALLIGSMRRTLCSKFYLHMYNGNVQQNPLCVESCVSKEFSISPRLSPTIFDPDANSVLLRAHTCTENLVFEIIQESVKVCTTGMPSRTLYAQHPASLRIFPSLPGSRLRFFIAGQIHHPTVHRFLYTPAQIDAPPCRLEAHYARNKKIKCVFCVAQHHLLLL